MGELQATLGKNFSEMISLVKEYLHPHPYSKVELCQLLNISNTYLDKVLRFFHSFVLRFFSQEQFSFTVIFSCNFQEILSENTLHLTEFQLYKRALHVFTEASRVWEFKSICNDWSNQCSPSQDETDQTLKQLGQIMVESHSSTQYLYECSHPQIDKIVACSKEIAYGARLTGAG